MNKTGKIEKSVPAHKGALITLKWNNEGTSLATGKYFQDPIYITFGFQNFYLENKPGPHISYLP